MATWNDVFRQDEALKPLAQAFYSAVRSTNGDWTAAILDVRFSTDEQGFIDKARVENRDGTLSSMKLPTEVVEHLNALFGARPTGEDRWYGVLIRVTAAGGCGVTFNYDPNCADDPSFFDS